jgi:hypothetical protein
MKREHMLVYDAATENYMIIAHVRRGDRELHDHRSRPG